MNDAFKEELLERLLGAYEQANISGESALDLDICYSVRNKMFSIDLEGVTHQLSAHYAADFSEGGDELIAHVKRWAQGADD